MIEHALQGTKKYWLLIFSLLAIIGIGFISYMYQLSEGLVITGMSRDVSWGLYIAQFTFLVGVAASAVMVVLPYYLHNYKAFGKMTILGEFLAISAVIMCGLFIFVDLGQPSRVMNILLYPSPTSIFFWDFISLGGYFLLNLIIGWVSLESERKSIAPPKWIKPLIFLSIPWAISIHTVTAFIYSGLGARSFWFTAIMAPRFLASAFAAGPALLILLTFIVRRVSSFDPGKEAVQTLAKIVTYAIILNVFFVLLELFTVFYSGIEEHMHHFQYLFIGLNENTALVPFMWVSAILAISAILLLLFPRTRNRESTLTIACIAVFVSIWIEKGMGMVVTGFIPSPLDKITEYMPTFPEILISLGVYGIGFFVLSVLYKIVISIRDKQA
jgi:molybdopterin-containing oxidoreductase family membrane subunit